LTSAAVQRDDRRQDATATGLGFATATRAVAGSTSPRLIIGTIVVAESAWLGLLGFFAYKLVGA
jgi:hypothetical protein